MEIAISAEGCFGLTWPVWKQFIERVDALGFSALYLSDHLVQPEPPDPPALEMIVALTFLASHSERLRFGSMVAPLSIRDPVVLARQAAELNDLSGGRFVLGVGTGWSDREHEMFGFELGDMPTRFARLEEGLQVITGLLRSDAPLDFEGRFYRLRRAKLAGARRAPAPRIMIGGAGPRRTLPLVASYADVWNGQLLTPDEYRERSALLDQMMTDLGREPATVRRTFNTFVVCGRTEEELERRMVGYRRYGPLATLAHDRVIHELRTEWGAIVGTPEEVVERIRAYEAAGVAELSIQWPSLEDIEGLELLAGLLSPGAGKD